MQRGRGERERDTVAASTVSFTHRKRLLHPPVTYPQQRTSCAPCQVASKRIARKKETDASRKHNNHSRTQQGNIAVQVKGKRESEGEQGISRRGRKEIG